MARTMTGDVGDEFREFIVSFVKAGYYRTQSELMRDTVRLLCEILQELRVLLVEEIRTVKAKEGGNECG